MVDGPLAGIRVLDVTNVYAGPTVGRILADLGAQVIHLEALQRLDAVRCLILAENDAGDEQTAWERGAYFIKRNLGKRDVTIDLTRPDGQELARGLIAASDVLVESFAPRVMQRFGFDYESVRAIRPDIVMISLSGYGQTGPWASRPGYDLIAQGEGGLMSVTGDAEGEPYRAGVAVFDVISGLHATIGVLAALNHRQPTGQGQHVAISLLASAT